MTLVDLKITAADYTGKDVSSLPDSVSGQASTVKARFDALVKELVATRFNALIDAIVPQVGEIEINTSGVNPATKYGVGTWELWGQGKMPIGVDASDSDFSEAEKVGGSKTKAFSLSSKGYAKIAGFGAGTSAPNTVYILGARISAPTYSVVTRSTASATTSGGSGSYATPLGGSTDEGDVMNPYITCYMWKRVA